MNFETIQRTVTRSFGRGGLLLKKYSPEILLGVGLVGGVVAAVLAAKATLKSGDIVEEMKHEIEGVDQDGASNQITEEEAIQKKAVVYVQTGLKFAQLYGPSVGLGVLSVGSILAAHGIMGRRQVALIAAYNLINEGFTSYRKRVVEELGPEADRNYRLGIREEKYSEKEIYADGTSATVKKVAKKYDPNTMSDYAKFFDESSPQWRNDPTLNLYFLKSQQNYANDILISRGHIFLNEVYDMLGIPRTKAGTVVGWLLREDPKEMKDENRDGYVDFGIYSVNNAPGRDFVNGYNKAILLDFNVDGIINHLIGERI